jgi:UDP-N-acetylmuramyl tripeptide synthase
LFFAATGAVLDVVGVRIDDPLLAAWRARIERAAVHLGWHGTQTVVRSHATGASLAITAPCDQLFLATEVNEWALCAALAARDPVRWGGLEQLLVAAARSAAENTPSAAHDLEPVIEESAALRRFEGLAALQINPKLRELLAEAAQRELPHVLDDAELTLGSGVAGRSYVLTALPSVAAVRWQELRGIPTAMVTGSNGKTTTVRLLAACARANGWRAGYNCTDGVFLDDEALAVGDYSGPAGARMVLRESRAQAAILETARGGILRRGIAESHADAAIITNVSSDHFGEYGIDDLEGLAEVKFAVASVLAPRGSLVLYADDAKLRARAEGFVGPSGDYSRLGWFALDADQETLREYRLRGSPTCGLRAGRLYLNQGGMDHDLGPVAGMPLSMDGIAAYNVANIAGAALVASQLGISPPTISAVLGRFGARLGDNPGRMMRFDVQGVKVLIDYAHNAEGLRGFLQVADHLRGGRGRLGLILGHAGNRTNADIEELARVAVDFRPDLVVVKENEAQLRGRAAGEVPQIIRAELLRLGFPESAAPIRGSEVEAARHAIDWSRPGDVLALPLHSAGARAAVMTMLQARQGNAR